MIVADTSVIVKTVVHESHSDVARRLRDQGIAAPAIWIAEAGNVLWRKQQIKAISKVEAATLFETLLAAPIRTLPLDTEAQDALEIAVALEHPIYDCFFLAAAIREDTHVVTDDSRFAAAVRRQGKWASRLRLLAEL
ncbi:MAG TPA: type II toxin-antitoxin system VapC family toxin [Rhizomicrobium sp.]|jgi:predicted nucleic acid-binding protein|nr:type II toxin-antitoxin system VapC family toxin [Rhizomicrobium sp.]